MAEPTATWTALDTANFDAGDFLRAPKFLEILQNIYHLAQTHNHDGGTADGGLLAVANPVYIMYIGPAAS